MGKGVLSRGVLVLLACAGCALAPADALARQASAMPAGERTQVEVVREVLLADLSRQRVRVLEIGQRGLRVMEAGIAAPAGSEGRWLAPADVLAVLPVLEEDAPSPTELLAARAPTSARTEQTFTSRGFAQVTPVRTTRTLPGRVRTTDGQEVYGEMDAGHGLRGDRVLLRSTMFGVLDIPLEIVREVIFPIVIDDRTQRESEVLADDWAGDQDRVVLRNNDVLTGFVEAGEGPAGALPTVRVVRDAARGDDGAEVELDVVARITLAGEALPRRGAWVWLSDGQALRVAPGERESAGVMGSFGIAEVRAAAGDADAGERGRSGGVRIRPALSTGANGDGSGAESRWAPVGDALRAWTLAHERVVALASLDMLTHAAAGERRWTPVPVLEPGWSSPLGLRDVELPGPMRISVTAPAGAERFATDLVLPRSSRAWGNCVVRVLVEGEVAFEASLHDGSPAARAVVQVRGGNTVSVEVDAGEDGPVQDRVVLRRALFLIGRD